MSGETILVIDDEPQIRRVMRSTLSTHGYVITEAMTGEDGVEAVRKTKPDLVLLDMNMPGIGGLEACKEIRRSTDAPIIIKRKPRHAHAFSLLRELLPEAKPESFALPRPRSERARKLADHLTAHPQDGRALEIIVAERGGASLRTFERLFLDETNLSLAAWRRQSRLLTSLSLLAEGKSIGEVAHAVGYDSAAAFGTAFKQCFGVTPSGYMAG